MKKNHALINARKKKGYTQVQLAELLQCKKTTVSNWENGYARPTLNVAYQVATLLDSDINILFFSNEDKDVAKKADEKSNS
ncbi:helix-turn-helix transcriptional regulator [Bacillus sp. T33-2]|uniref:helix-turn-helix transcriptional regulator n=1 Tax=Bacillus sp. T33-2 TaxID=2054168 RepID=UPI000C770CEB|nr:helix-turn-helix transcriptional regulator [Bacillus sp. T33-2]PLR91109.1 XRE family transcriptional regulator [Bacillus sp. T33-2]